MGRKHPAAGAARFRSMSAMLAPAARFVYSARCFGPTLAENCVDHPFFPSVSGTRFMRVARPAPLGTDALPNLPYMTGWLGLSPAARFTGNAPGFSSKLHHWMLLV